MCVQVIFETYLIIQQSNGNCGDICDAVQAGKVKRKPEES